MSSARHTRMRLTWYERTTTVTILYRGRSVKYTLFVLTPIGSCRNDSATLAKHPPSASCRPAVRLSGSANHSFGLVRCCPVRNSTALSSHHHRIMHVYSLFSTHAGNGKGGAAVFLARLLPHPAHPPSNSEAHLHIYWLQVRAVIPMSFRGE
ncbi:hypothetical protein BAUCODRAFT_435878 [Baudoinia panamericana UAMH 10762]|uniref:Uncharacterized protein n=1 Tax=Baudoinia panamericana (strain UAMH 10762) TaxID=717646 RepID=M2LRG5_BAUPA|nr:uncharacterized protein BAUCODRAFT_435878 [Baudoinia panamericana UAMH 10762]EMC97027.1 hypothetical protein BAUCODRAFT_435878 [Baudoinia panamericana UAMH 10762]